MSREVQKVETFKFGSYEVTKRGTSTKDYSTPEHLSKWNEEQVTQAVYNVAPRVYTKRNWQGTRYTLEDFCQDSAMYILRLYRTNYFSTDRDNIEPIIYRLLNGFFSFNKLKELRKVESRVYSYDSYDLKTPGDYSFVDVVGEGTDEDMAVDIEAGKEVIVEILENLSDKEVESKKYEYYGMADGKRYGLSERNIASLLFSGKTAHDIIDFYGKTVDWIGSSSEATFVFHKVQGTLDKIKSVLSGLGEEAEECLRNYLEIKSGERREKNIKERRASL